MSKLWYAYVNLCERSVLSKHVRKNKAPLTADFVLDLFNFGTYIYVPKTKKGYMYVNFARAWLDTHNIASAAT